MWTGFHFGYLKVCTWMSCFGGFSWPLRTTWYYSKDSSPRPWTPNTVLNAKHLIRAELHARGSYRHGREGSVQCIRYLPFVVHGLRSVSARVTKRFAHLVASTLASVVQWFAFEWFRKHIKVIQSMIPCSSSTPSASSRWYANWRVWFRTPGRFCHKVAAYWTPLSDLVVGSGHRYLKQQLRTLFLISPSIALIKSMSMSMSMYNNS